MNTQAQLYIKGFNHGYILEKYLPELSAKMTKTVVASNDYTEGLLDGKEECEIERTTSKLGDIRKGSRDRERDR